MFLKLLMLFYELVVGLETIKGLLVKETLLISDNFLVESLLEWNVSGSGLIQGQIIFLKILLNFLSKNPYITTLTVPFTTADRSKSDTARVLPIVPKYIAPKMTNWLVMLQTKNTKMIAMTFLVILSSVFLFLFVFPIAHMFPSASCALFTWKI